jgi:DNA-binding LytR/AlgR family response regulator
MISQLDDFICIETFQNALDAYNYLETNDVDVVFLDVEMPKMGGIELLKSLKKSPMVVMITSHEEFALESYEYNVTDFLKKPAEWSRFLKTIEKIRKEFLDLAAQLLESSDQEHVFIKTDSKLVQLNLSQVLWVEALGNYIRVHTEEDKYTVLSTMKEIEAKLPPKDFIRVQRSFIIRVDKVKAIEDNYIIIKDKEIHIGKSYKEDFNKRINYL